MTSTDVGTVPLIDTIDERTVSDLALGATLLGTGGGGDPRIGALMAQAAIREHGPVRVIAPEAVGDDGVVVPVAMIGAPDRDPRAHPGWARARPRDGSLRAAPAAARDRHDAHRGGWHQLDDPARARGQAWPAPRRRRRHGPRLPRGPDGDPRGGWCHGLATGPGRRVVERRQHLRRPRQRVRRTTRPGRGGGHGGIGGRRPLRGERRAPAGLGGAAQRLPRGRHRSGPAPRTRGGCGPDRGHRPHLRCDEALHRPGGRRAALHAGRVRPRPADPEGPRRRRRAAAPRSTSRTRTSIVRSEDRVLAAVPDLISLVEADSGQPLTTEGMRFGLRVHVVGIPASPVWWRPEALPLVEPRAFGYDMDPIRLGDPR